VTAASWVRESHLSGANVSIGDQLGASVFTIHGGFLFPCF
jgi:hypothetical protein